MRTRSPSRKVQRIELPSRPLSVLRVGKLARSADLKGAIVWIDVQPDDSRESVEAFELALKKAGAAQVSRILPKSDKVVADAVEISPQEVPTVEGLRVAALELVDEAMTDDRQRLRDAVESALDEVGV